jgi:hypothetical protein
MDWQARYGLIARQGAEPTPTCSGGALGRGLCISPTACTYYTVLHPRVSQSGNESGTLMLVLRSYLPDHHLSQPVSFRSAQLIPDFRSRHNISESMFGTRHGSPPVGSAITSTCSNTYTFPSAASFTTAMCLKGTGFVWIKQRKFAHKVYFLQEAP